MLGSILRNMTIMVGLMVGGMFVLSDHGFLAGSTDSAPRDRAAAASPSPISPAQATSYADTLVIERGRGGHYRVDAEINGRTVRMLVDTGATMVALSRQDAERIGLATHQLYYTGRVRTANGIARVARVTLDEISLGDIALRDVAAAVIDAPLGTSLLGMSFLGRLDGFTIEDGRLVLRR